MMNSSQELRYLINNCYNNNNNSKAILDQLYKLRAIYQDLYLNNHLNTQAVKHFVTKKTISITQYLRSKTFKSLFNVSLLATLISNNRCALLNLIEYKATNFLVRIILCCQERLRLMEVHNLEEEFAHKLRPAHL